MTFRRDVNQGIITLYWECNDKIGYYLFSFSEISLKYSYLQLAAGKKWRYTGRVMTETVSLQDLYDGQQLLFKLMSKLDRKVDGLDSKISGLDSRLNKLENEMTELRTFTAAGFETMNGRFDWLENQLDIA